MKGTIPYGTSTLNNGAGLVDQVIAGPGISVNSTDPTKPIVSVCTDSVANIAALSALNTALYCTGDRVWVVSKKATYVLDKVATGTADANFYATTLSGTGRWIRQLAPVPQWQQAALATAGGLFIDPVSGDDEAAGTSSGTALKTMPEFCARLFGGVFTAAPKLTAVTGSTNAADRMLWGFEVLNDTRMILQGTETVVAASVALTAAADLAATSAVGFLTSTTTNFLSLGYTSNATRTLWARRSNTVGTAITYAPLQFAHNSGGNFSVDIGKQFELTTAPLVQNTTQVFAAGDAGVDLVSLPVWPGLLVPRYEMGVVVLKLDFASNAFVQGPTRIFVCGARGALNATCDASSSISGLMCCGGLNLSQCTYTCQFVALGAQGLATASLSSTGITSLSTCTIQNGNLSAVGVGSIVMGDNGDSWIQNSTTLFTTTRFGQIIINAASNLGIGGSVVNAGSIAGAGRLVGSARIIRVNAFTAGSPWTIGGITYTDAALVASGIFDVNTLCAVVQ